jgi:hypothetical protein
MTLPTGATQQVAIGTFEFRDKADAAVTALQRAGFEDAEIGVLARRTSEWDDLIDRDASLTADESAATGAIAGATAGAGVGGLWALGVAAGIVPAIGPIVAGGVLGSILASAAAGAAAGGVGGALLGLGLSEDEAARYHDEFLAGSTVVTVRAGHRYSEAVSILLDHGAVVSASETPATPIESRP